jgi:hypothetical protein
VAQEQPQELGSKARADEVFGVPSLCGVSCDMHRSWLFFTLTAGCVPRRNTVTLRAGRGGMHAQHVLVRPRFATGSLAWLTALQPVSPFQSRRRPLEYANPDLVRR